MGLSIATLLSQHNHVEAVDIVPEKVELINNGKSPIQDNEIEEYLATKQLDLHATLDAQMAYSQAEFVVIAAPTNYDSTKNFFDTSAVEAVINLVMQYNPQAIMVIKSTIPVGYTESIRQKTGSKNIIFAPEFLRESRALYDNLYPSRIIVGYDQQDKRLEQAAHTFADLIKGGAIKQDVPVLYMGTTEAMIVLTDATDSTAKVAYTYDGEILGYGRMEYKIDKRSDTQGSITVSFHDIDQAVSDFYESRVKELKKSTVYRFNEPALQIGAFINSEPLTLESISPTEYEVEE